MVLLGFLILTFFGALFLRLISHHGRWYETVALSYLLGFGSMSIVYFLFTLITDSVQVGEFWLLLLSLVMLLFVMNCFIRPFRPGLKNLLKIKLNLFPQSAITYISWLLIAVLFGIIMIYALYFGVYTKDSIALYDFRAKAMYITGTLSAVMSVPSWKVYPMFTSEVNLFIRFMGGDNPAVFYPLMYLAFAAIFFSTLRTRLNTTLSSIGTALMYSTPITLWQSRLDGMTNLPYTIFFSTALIYLFRYRKRSENDIQNLTISSIFLSLMVWTRATEPIWLVVVLVALYVLFVRKRVLLIIPYLTPFLLVYKSWSYFISNVIISAGAGIGVVAGYITENIDSVGFWQRINDVFGFTFPILLKSLSPVIIIFSILFLFQTLSRGFKDGSQLFFLYCTLGTFAVIFGGVLFFSINFSYWEQLDVALSRLSGVLSPLMWMYIMLFPGWSSLAITLGRLVKK